MKKVPRWVWGWLIQALVMALLSVLSPLCALSSVGARTLTALMRYLILPAAGCLSALLAVRFGLNPYAAWILPPVLCGLLPWAMVGFPPPFGGVLLCAFLSLIGAAAGDVLQKQKKEERR